MDISVNIHYFKLKFSVFDQNILLEGSMSQRFDLDHSFHFMSKNGLLLEIFCLCQFLHFIK